MENGTNAFPNVGIIMIYPIPALPAYMAIRQNTGKENKQAGE